MTEFKISEIMKKDHLKLIQALEVLKDFIRNKAKNIQEQLDLFKWELEKHFFIEEKAIFLFYDPNNELDRIITPKLVKEHENILNYVNALEDNIRSALPYDISHLELLLIKHRKYEDEVIYPKFDIELEESTKKMICRRIENPVK